MSAAVVNVIRPGVSPGFHGPSTQPDPARLEAKRALFAEAFGKAAATAQTAPLEAAAPVQTPIARVERPTETPQKILRPGSLLDIRV